MKFRELKPMSKDELAKKMLEVQKELMKDNAQVATGTIPKNPGKIKLAKKTIARIKMLLSQAEESKKA